MNKDKQLHALFQASPKWLYELMGELPPVGGCSYQSVTVKDFQRGIDGLVCPTDKRLPLLISEAQMQRKNNIYARLAMEMGRAQLDHKMRAVTGIIVFQSAVMDPKTKPWATIIRVASVP